MFLDSFFKKIGEIFSGLFNAAKRTWAKLSPVVQKALIHGSGVIDLINTNVAATPQFVLDLIQKKFPDLDIPKLTEGLKSIAKELHIVQDINSVDLLQTIEALQKHLASLKGKIWALISSSMAQILSTVLAPAETKVAAIISLMEFVYQHFIKKQDLKAAA